VKPVVRGAWCVVRSGRNRGDAISMVLPARALERRTHHAPRTTVSRRLARTTQPRTTHHREQEAK